MLDSRPTKNPRAAQMTPVSTLTYDKLGLPTLSGGLKGKKRAAEAAAAAAGGGGGGGGASSMHAEEEEEEEEGGGGSKSLTDFWKPPPAGFKPPPAGFNSPPDGFKLISVATVAQAAELLGELELKVVTSEEEGMVVPHGLYPKVLATLNEVRNVK